MLNNMLQFEIDFRLIKIVTTFFILIGLVACTTTSGPVVIRDVSSAGTSPSPFPKIEKESEKRALDKNNTKEKQVAIAEPVLQNQKKQVIPLVENLILKANEEYQKKSYELAINLAERGLRVNRKEPRLYLVLAKTYNKLKNKKQSIRFAKQGLRYAEKDSGAYLKLKSVAR